MDNAGPATLTDDDFPALFRAADRAARVAQRRYLWLRRADLASLVAAALLGATGHQIAQRLGLDDARAVLTVSSAIFMSFALFLTGVMRQVRYERTWYDARAIAESVKTRAWRYMTRSEPYGDDFASAADRTFIDDLSAILAERKGSSVVLAGDWGAEEQITDRMRAVRGLDAQARKAFYLSQRVDDQRKWYSGKAVANGKSEDRWLLATMVSQVLAIIWVILAVRDFGLPRDITGLTGVFPALAAVSVAWTQLKQHQVLAQSYGLAAQELALIKEQARYIGAEDELASYVADAENAISREHTLWVARRNRA